MELVKDIQGKAILRIETIRIVITVAPHTQDRVCSQVLKIVSQAEVEVEVEKTEKLAMENGILSRKNKLIKVAVIILVRADLVEKKTNRDWIATTI